MQLLPSLFLCSDSFELKAADALPLFSPLSPLPVTWLVSVSGWLARLISGSLCSSLGNWQGLAQPGRSGIRNGKMLSQGQSGESRPRDGSGEVLLAVGI